MIKLGVKIRSPKRQAMKPVMAGGINSLISGDSASLNEDEEESLEPQIVFVGKSDSGKSSIIQMMSSGAFGVLDKFSKQAKVPTFKFPF